MERGSVLGWLTHQSTLAQEIRAYGIPLDVLWLIHPRNRVGLFWLREAEVLPQGVVRIITTDCMFDDCGLVYSPAGVPPRIGEDMYEALALGGPWYHWWRGW